MKLLNNGMSKILLVLFLFILTNYLSLVAQEEIDDGNSTSEEVTDCKPTNFENPYLKFKSDTIAVKQVQIWYSFGHEEYKHKQYANAIPYFWKVLVNDKVGTFKVVFSKLVTCYQEIGKTAENTMAYLDTTLAIIYKGIEAYPEHEKLNFHAGRIQRSRSNYKCAIPHYRVLVAKNPQQTNYLKVLADLLFKIEDPECIEVQQKLIDLKPNNTEYRDTMVRMVQSFGGEIIDVLRKAYLSDPTNIVNALRYGHEALMTGAYDNALAAFQDVVQQDPKHIEAREQIAKCYEGLNKISDAIKTYREILGISPKNINVLCSIARLYMNQKNFSQARANVIQAKRIDNQNGAPYMVMAEIYSEAAEHCSSQRNDNKGYSYDDKLVFEKARAEYKKAKRDPNYASKASSLYKGLRDFIRTKEDIFMHKRETIKDSCYNWIK